MTLRSLRLRLVLAGAAAVALALALAGVGLVALFAAHVERRAAAELSVQLDQLIAGLAEGSDGRLAVTAPPADPRFRRPLGGLYWQVEADRTLRSRSLWDQALALPPDALPDGAVHVHRLSGPAGGTVLVLERSVTLPGRGRGEAVRVAVAMDAADLAAAVDAFRGDLAVYLAVLGAVLVLAAVVQVAVGLGPLATVGERVTAVRSGASRRLGTDFPDEVRPLAAEVDALIAARENDVERARDRAGVLAHGLKTPLQALLGEAGRLREAGLAERAEAVEEIALSMRRHVERELARARIAVAARTARVEIRPVVDRVLGVVRRTPDGTRLSFENAVEPGLFAALDPDDLAEALGALVENAARHASARVAIRSVTADGTASIVVADDGPGLPAEAVEAVRRRGGRLDEAHPGEGFGLSIATEIAEAVGGAIVLANGLHGLEARLDLPRGAPAAGPPPASARSSGPRKPARSGARTR